jgi:hypothetical protein
MGASLVKVRKDVLVPGGRNSRLQPKAVCKRRCVCFTAVYRVGIKFRPQDDALLLVYPPIDAAFILFIGPRGDR